MLFQNLKSLLDGNSSVVLSLTMDKDGLITVTVIPKSSNDAKVPALATPLVLTGTADELDAEFFNLLQSFTASRKSLAEQAEVTATVLEAAKANQQNQATKALETKGKTKSKSAEPAPADDEDEGGDIKPEPVTSGDVVQNETPAAVATAPSTNLWD